ncbi:hypothetical protein M2336_001294 [Sphingobium sp. B1D7B]|uniref:hypothetical protein n=1 Tax=unclassified Sphingobium TaxID=2611147 RepID=UPI00222468E4|nr:MULTISPECIES: hypothetical protein [unclassified Sphingobium]MCW2351502.1 hypothetical protein [Sphingobium sp. B12D2B]MCW2370724.1 hypothetical protein [Sphingobium sp. B11D3D]MCW2392863.1 hypothetical protein [Sphingobium sp. B11D3A]MCW2404665.1 hypothetical protein [Sphingobium sp. B1D7B]
MGLLLALAASAATAAAAAGTPAAAPPQGQPAETLRRIPAEEARQGVAVGPNDVYAVANWTIARYDRKTGARRAVWTGEPARYPHINSCALIKAELVCAASNFPSVPQASSVEIFDPVTLAHKRTVSLGLGTGSLTWVDWHDGHWWGLFANYDGKGGEAPRDHRHTTLVQFDTDWRRTQSWALPATILERIAPMSISGGGFGPDGRLWLSGHDNPELYVTQLPKGGATLDHIATVPMEAEGQAIDWDENRPGILWGISRKTRAMLEMRVPPVQP